MTETTLKIAATFIACILVAACSEIEELKPAIDQESLASAPSSLEKEPSPFSNIPDPLPLIALNPAPPKNAANVSPLQAAIVPNPSFRAGSLESLRAQAGDLIYFTNSQSELDPRNREVLTKVATWLKENPNRILLLEGHTPQTITREFGVGLAASRANLVAGFLREQGIEPSRLKARAFGRERIDEVKARQQRRARVFGRNLPEQKNAIIVVLIPARR